MIGGTSSGGILAYDIAGLLEQKKYTCIKSFLFDSPQYHFTFNLSKKIVFQ